MWSALLISAVLFLLGASVGSFVNLVIYRTVYGQNWWWGRSICETCQKTIHWFDNVPLLSYWWLKGKCRFCRSPITLSHPVIEFLTGILFVWWYWFGSLFFLLTHAPFQTLQPMFWLGVGILLIMIVVADLLYLLIPDVAVGLLLLLTVGYRIGLTVFGVMRVEDLVKSVMGMILVLCFFGGLWLVTRGKGMGLGDVKLVAPLALLMGWPRMLVGLFLAFICGAIYGLGVMLNGKYRLGQVVPFGPFLVMGTVVALLMGEGIVNWYLGLF